MSFELPKSRSGKSAADVARICLWEAGQVLMGFYGSNQQVELKSRGNVLTEADLAAEQTVLGILKIEYPGIPVLSEESAAETKSDDWLWVVDPLDGSHNFSKGIPHFCLNIALCQYGEPLLGLTFEPMKGEEFIAIKGEGLLVNGRPALSSTTSDLESSVLGMDLGYDDQRAAQMLTTLSGIWPGIQAVRVAGSAALGLAYAACGRYDLFVHRYLFPWDVAAGIVMVKEGGGDLVDENGNAVTLDSKSVVAGSPMAVKEFLDRSKGVVSRVDRSG